MTQRMTVTLYNAQQAGVELSQVWAWLKAQLTAGNRMQVVARKQTRSLDQNRIMWSCLTDLSKQVTWFGKRLTPEGWKDWITGHLNGQELHPNMDGTGFISINRGSSTSDMTIAEMSAVIELCHAFGADKDVKWSKTSLGRNEWITEDGEIMEAE
jgi:hypothetical protein